MDIHGEKVIKGLADSVALSRLNWDCRQSCSRKKVVGALLAKEFVQVEETVDNVGVTHF